RLCVFFFSSRRRHTRSKRDWSSDVCSSDLSGAIKPTKKRPFPGALCICIIFVKMNFEKIRFLPFPGGGRQTKSARLRRRLSFMEIGRASCRERGENSVGEGGGETRGDVGVR